MGRADRRVDGASGRVRRGRHRVRVGPGGESEVAGREQRVFTWAAELPGVSWSDGLGNGALPCAAHHTMLHEGGWSLHRTSDGRYLLRHRDGKAIGPESHSAGHSRPPPHRTE